MQEGLRESFLQFDEALEKEDGQEELAEMKRKNPPNKNAILKLLGEHSGSGEQTKEQLMLDSIGCTANVIYLDDMK